MPKYLGYTLEENYKDYNALDAQFPSHRAKSIILKTKENPAILKKGYQKHQEK